MRAPRSPSRPDPASLLSPAPGVFHMLCCWADSPGGGSPTHSGRVEPRTRARQRCWRDPIGLSKRLCEPAEGLRADGESATSRTTCSVRLVTTRTARRIGARRSRARAVSPRRGRGGIDIAPMAATIARASWRRASVAVAGRQASATRHEMDFLDRWEAVVAAETGRSAAVDRRVVAWTYGRPQDERGRRRCGMQWPGSAWRGWPGDVGRVTGRGMDGMAGRSGLPAAGLGDAAGRVGGDRPRLVSPIAPRSR